MKMLLAEPRLRLSGDLSHAPTTSPELGLSLNSEAFGRGGDDSDVPSPNKMITKYVSQEEFLRKILAEFESTIRMVVRQELEAKLGPLQSCQRCSFFNQPESSTSRTLQLIFANKLQSTFYTNSKIVAEGHSFVTVQLVDANSREVINYAPFGSVGVKIFATRGDFVLDEQEDRSNKALDDGVMCEREGKRPLLIGELSFSLTHGAGFIKDVVFTDNSSWLRSRKFRLGVRAVPNTVNGVLIKEGISEAFVVLDQRGESSQKSNTPLLNDPLWRLKKISKTGAVCTKLAENGIHTVEDFLKLYHVNSKLLRNIVGSGIGNKTWETIVENANACCLDNKIYSYYHAADGVGISVNTVYKVLGVTFDGINYQSIDTLDSQQMVLVELLKQYIYCNPNVLSLINVSSSTCPSISSQFQMNDPVCGPSLDPWVSVTPFTNQGKMLDVSHSYPSCPNPNTVYGGYQAQEDIATHSTQPIEGADWGLSMLLNVPPTLVRDENLLTEPSTCQPIHCADWSSSSLAINEPIDEAYDVSMVLAMEDQNFVPQSSTWYPVGSLATSSGSNLLAGGKSKGRWLKVRSVIMWKIVKRGVAAKKKGKFLLGYF